MQQESQHRYDEAEKIDLESTVILRNFDQKITDHDTSNEIYPEGQQKEMFRKMS